MLNMPRVVGGYEESIIDCTTLLFIFKAPNHKATVIESGEISSMSIYDAPAHFHP